MVLDSSAHRTSGETAGQEAWQRIYAGEEAQVPALPAGFGPAQPAERSGTDALAAWQRWHPGVLDARFDAAEWPWYVVLERARVETLAGRDLPGMASNLSDLDSLAPAGARTARLHRLARSALTGQDPGEGDDASGVATMDIGDRAVTGRELEPATEPGATGRLRTLLARWRPRAAVAAARMAWPTDARIVRTLSQARPSLGDAAAFADQVIPLVRALALAADADGHTLSATPPQPPSRQEESQPIVNDESASEPELAAQGDPDAVAVDDRRYPGYMVYSTRWDQTLDAARLCRPGDTLRLQQIPASDQRVARRLALRLQRRLMTARLRRWSFDQDEGRLDSRRLARLLTGRPPYPVFRREDESPVPEACVTLLVDQSGSMRGPPQRLTVQAIDLAVQTLEICRIRCEVLGFTTRYGADNPLVHAWQAAGRPSAPGRLNALRHLVYKRADQPWRRCRPSLGLLLREDLGHENIDGEALDWAARRLLARPEPRKILVVLCDGAPYDEATAAANGRRFLADHARQVIAALETSPIRLAALGTARTVAHYYRQSLVLHRPEEVTATLFDHLGDLLAPPAPDRSRP